MCTVILLIAASDELDRMNGLLAALDRRGQAPRRAERSDTPELRALLRPNEREYLLVRPPCDCGTFLGHAVHGAEGGEDDRVAALARYRQKGWSEAKIARAMGDRDRAGERPARRPPNEDAAYWTGLMTALGQGLGLTRLGLMHHLEDRSRPLAATRRDAGPVAAAAGVLARMPDGVIHDFGIGAT
jgi:hypothetical protein